MRMTQERHYAGIEISSRRHLQRLAREPSGAPCVDGVKRGAVQARHVGPNFLAGAHQRVGKMAISLRVTCEQFTVELQGRRRIDRIEAILLQDRLEQHDPQRPLRFSRKK